MPQRRTPAKVKENAHALTLGSAGLYCSSRLGMASRKNDCLLHLRTIGKPSSGELQPPFHDVEGYEHWSHQQRNLRTFYNLVIYTKCCKAVADHLVGICFI